MNEQNVLFLFGGKKRKGQVPMFDNRSSLMKKKMQER